jgi:GntR family transcriptional regulator
MFELSPADSRPLYRQIVDEVLRHLAIGVLHADEPLPAVRHLAAQLKVNPNTILHSYRELERAGIVYVRRGRGTFIARTAVLPSGHDRRRQALVARQVAERALRDAFRHGLLASDLIAAIRDIAPKTER